MTEGKYVPIPSGLARPPQTDPLGLAGCVLELIATVVYYKVIVPWLSTNITMNLHVYNFTSVPVGAWLNYMNEGYVTQCYMNELGFLPLPQGARPQPALARPIIPAGQASNSRVNYASFLVTNHDSVTGIGFTLALGWNDKGTNLSFPPLHKLAAGVDIPFVAPQGPRIRLDWSEGGPDWYSDEVEGGNDHGSYWPVQVAAQTPVRATLTLQQVPGVANAYIGVLYLVDQQVRVPEAIGAIVQGNQPPFYYVPPMPGQQMEPAPQPATPAPQPVPAAPQPELPLIDRLDIMEAQGRLGGGGN